MRVLVTNDDGYTAPGLVALVRRLLAAGHDVTVAAPLRQQSGGSAALGRVIDGATIAWQAFSSPELEGISRGIAVDAPPALAVKVMLGGAFGPPPDVVVSGINRGWNTGGSTLHSGTLGAAMTACGLGWRAAAISCGRPPHGNLATAAEVAVAVVELLGQWQSPVALNVNVPNLPVADLKGFRRAPIGAQGLLDVDVVLDGEDLRFKLVSREPATDSNCDAQTVLDGYVAISPLSGGYSHCAHPCMLDTAVEAQLLDRLKGGSATA
jgi:5'-nucleotidase